MAFKIGIVSLVATGIELSILMSDSNFSKFVTQIVGLINFILLLLQSGGEAIRGNYKLGSSSGSSWSNGSSDSSWSSSSGDSFSGGGGSFGGWQCIWRLVKFSVFHFKAYN